MLDMPETSVSSEGLLSTVPGQQYFRETIMADKEIHVLRILPADQDDRLECEFFRSVLCYFIRRRAVIMYGDQQLGWHGFADAIALVAASFGKVQAVGDAISRYFKPMVPIDSGAYRLVHTVASLSRKGTNGIVQERPMSLEILVTSLLIPFEARNHGIIFTALTPTSHRNNAVSGVVKYGVRSAMTKTNAFQ
ncbi:hypothetical protein BJ878DRAFT_552204 [Calycina marina]|uniref:Uncharacterized protein n=1 Tax=Calycina marina TaxID=1763456 RepID=A0A9P7Z248_9HELO|nr:hypothetical protein BJ878DRAFT_552204 [Calycina marina]